MKLNPRINIPGKLGRGVESVFDYFLINRNTQNTFQEFTSGALTAIAFITLIYFSNFNKHRLTRLHRLAESNYPTHQEVVNVMGERALRQYEREKAKQTL